MDLLSLVTTTIRINIREDDRGSEPVAKPVFTTAVCCNSSAASYGSD
jgi:hypothetical protein